MNQEQELAEAFRVIARAFNRAANLIDDKKKNRAQKTTVDEAVSLQDFTSKCKASARRDIQLIGMWAEITKPDLTTKSQWHTFLKRHIKDAQTLSRFSDSQIKAGFEKMSKAKIDKPTMGTVIKFLT